MKKHLTFAALLTPLVCFSEAHASIPPPPPQYVVDIANKVIPNLTDENFAKFASTLDQDLVIKINGLAFCKSKPSCLSEAKLQIGKVKRKVLSYTIGQKSVLIIDRFDDYSSTSTSRTLGADPRFSTRAILYSIKDNHLVGEINIVQSDGLLSLPQ